MGEKSLVFPTNKNFLSYVVLSVVVSLAFPGFNILLYYLYTVNCDRSDYIVIDDKNCNPALVFLFWLEMFITKLDYIRQYKRTPLNPEDRSWYM